MKIGFLGGGNMASALVGGLLAKGFEPRSITVIEVSPAARERIAAKFQVRVSTAPDAVMQECDTLVLAVKPQDMKAALASLASRSEGKLFIGTQDGGVWKGSLP